MNLSFTRAMALAALPVLLLALDAGTASAQPAGGGPPPPKGFEADSASFVSARTGFVLGTRGCGELPCPARLEKTVNGGKTWTKVPAPAASLVPPFSGTPLSAVSTVRFSSASDGWLFDPGLWATTDGGRHWHRVSLPGAAGRAVVALAASDGVVLASAEPVDGSLNAARLYRSEVGSGKWTLVSKVAPAAALTVSGHSVWAGIAPKLWRSTDSGRHWSKLSFTCPSDAADATAVAAASASDVALACSNLGFPLPGSSFKKVFTSSNGGRTFRLAGRAGRARRDRPAGPAARSPAGDHADGGQRRHLPVPVGQRREGLEGDDAVRRWPGRPGPGLRLGQHRLPDPLQRRPGHRLRQGPDEDGERRGSLEGRRDPLTLPDPLHYTEIAGSRLGRAAGGRLAGGW